MKIRFIIGCSFSALLLATAGCDRQNVSLDRGVYMLLDTSGTYTKELKQAQRIINYTLARLEPGDTFAVARIDTGSFSEKDIIQKQTFDDRPSMANNQKRVFQESISKFIDSVKSSQYTDITGGLLQGIEYLDEANPGKKILLIFSDLKEEIKEGYVRDLPLALEGYIVIAVNVTKLRQDNIDPRKYQNRMASWRAKVEKGGGEWRVINDLERLDPIFD